jgi:hypothetical protein
MKRKESKCRFDESAYESALTRYPVAARRKEGRESIGASPTSARKFAERGIDARLLELPSREVL